MPTGSPSETPPWYKPEIGSRMKPTMRALFENYSRIAPDNIESHVHAIRDRAWSLQKYPCIGQWIFLMSRTPDLPWYQDILLRLKGGASILDIGCCFGQDLRFLAADGAQTEKMYACDIMPEFWEIGYDLFCDAGRMKAQFLTANILDASSSLNQIDGGVDVLLVNQILHLFDWERQVEAAKNMVAISKPGTWVVGYQMGNEQGKAMGVQSRTSGGQTGTAGRQTKFHHNSETWNEMWRQIARETGTEWAAESQLVMLKDLNSEEEDYAWMDPTARVLNFIVRRVDSSAETAKS